jgi:hypothetical protein
LHSENKKQNTESRKLKSDSRKKTFLPETLTIFKLEFKISLEFDACYLALTFRLLPSATDRIKTIPGVQIQNAVRPFVSS